MLLVQINKYKVDYGEQLRKLVIFFQEQCVFVIEWRYIIHEYKKEWMTLFVNIYKFKDEW